MISLMAAFSRNFSILPVKGFYKVFIIFTFSLFSLAIAQSKEASAPGKEASAPGKEASAPGKEASAPGKEAPVPDKEASVPIEEAFASDEDEFHFSDPSYQNSFNPLVMSPRKSDYTNFAQEGAYVNEGWFEHVPEWHYYDMFGNKLVDGYYLYGISREKNTHGTGISDVALHPFLKKWLNGLVQAADLHENGGIMAMVGDRVKSEFTPFSLKQTLFAGARVDVFYKQNSLSFLTNRISNGGTYGMLLHEKRERSTADWLTGVHGGRQFGEVVDVYGTYVNIHHEDGKWLGDPFSGRDFDTLTKKTYTGLSLYGLDLKLKLDKLQAYGEYLRSQEYLDGTFKPKAGDVATLNAHWDIFNRWRLGGEFYTIGSRFKTNFSCPANDLDTTYPHPDADLDHRNGDYAIFKYQYSLVEDNDDRDEYPENGMSKYPYFTPDVVQQGDPDGPIPADWDKDKNGRWDYEEDFLNYDADPPESRILFDRNNNGIADEMENDAYPDYPYVPSYYLPGERYRRYDDFNHEWVDSLTDSLADSLPERMMHKGLAGLHLYSHFEIFRNVELTIGGIFDRSQEKTFQPTYENGVETDNDAYETENAMSLYFLTHYKKDIARDKYFMIDNLFRKIRDNIPNHTQGFHYDQGNNSVSYYTIVDELDYRDMFADALRAEFTLFRNRGFNYTAAGKYEFRKNFERPDFNYPEATINSLTLINKCHYIFLLPFFKDMFLTPRYKNIWDTRAYGPRSDSLPDTSLDAKYRRNTMINTASLVFQWNITGKTGLTTGLQVKQFNDFIDIGENYLQPCFGIQLRIKDRYRSTTLILTTGFSTYAYIYERPGRLHNRLNNPHRVEKNIDDHQIFIRIHCGLL